MCQLSVAMSLYSRSPSGRDDHGDDNEVGEAQIDNKHDVQRNALSRLIFVRQPCRK
jgi:hypothetical protein